MNTAQPIKKLDELERMKAYYRDVTPNLRNYLLIVMGCNTALRISDILALTWEKVYDFKRDVFLEHITIVEQKTDKHSSVYINSHTLSALTDYLGEYRSRHGFVCGEHYIFCNTTRPCQPISRVQAFRIVKRAAEESGLYGCISCHSLRKTFGYHAWKKGIQPALLMSIYNHSSFEVTTRYLGIDQDDRDKLFHDINL